MKYKKRTMIFVAILVAVGLGVTAISILKNGSPAEPEPTETHHVPAEKEKEGKTGPLVDAVEDIWLEDEETGYNGFTTRAQLGGDAESIGVLTIEKISVSTHVYDSEDVMEDMKKGAAHYKSTSYWDGNIGLSAHNGNASYSYFDRLHELVVGDTITYETTLGVREYAVVTIEQIADDDWSYLGRSEDNRITLTTCTADSTIRLCVQAVEI